jgi:glucan phosphoethanolaminetransferase (alkaline phosphatase superfamily)
LETILSVLVFVITGSLSAKSIGIFYFIFDLLSLRNKLDAVQISDYNLKMRGLNLNKQIVLIAFAAIEIVILVLIALRQQYKDNSLLAADLAMRACNILIYTYMFLHFVKLITFFQKKKKENLRLQQRISSCRHSTTVFVSQLLGGLNFIENLLILVYPITILVVEAPVNTI